MGILSVDLDKISLDEDNDFHEDDPEILFVSDFWLVVINLKNAKHLKKI